MPRQTVDLSLYLNAIRLKVAYRETYTDIAAWLLREHDVKITASWLQQKCRDLGVQAYQARTIDVQALTIIQQRFFYTFDNDEMISTILGNAGFDMKAKSVKQIRHQHGWLRRVASGADAEAEQLRVNASIEAAYEEGVVRQYGYRMMHTALRNRGVHAKRDRVATGLQIVDPDGVLFRTQKPQPRVRGVYKSAGPNWMWAVDGHSKLSRWGIDIYGCIDTFSRRLMWLYVGHSAQTQLSVARQFALVVQQKGVFPKRIRADRGSETMMLADSQFNLYRHWLLQEGLVGTLSDLGNHAIRECFLFGPSTRNIRIEGYWGHLQKSQLSPWREYCQWLELEGHWDATLPDRVVLLYFLMPIIRFEVQAFVQTWNAHKIRAQSNRPDLVVGIPNNLYTRPPAGAPDYARQAPPAAIQNLLDLTASVDHEVYLPPQTLAWCAAQLTQIGFHDVPVSGHFIGKDRVFRMPWYFKAVLTNARLHELSGVDRALPLKDRNIALLDSLKAGYHHVPAAAVVRGWKESSSVEYVQFAEEYMQDAMGASDRE